SHGGPPIQQFGQLYMVNRELEREIGKKVIKALNMRNKARYDPKTDIKEDDAKFIIELGGELIKEIENKIYQVSRRS
ncbi:MAG: hypothetical protein ACE5J3_10430, partial [Methanosarcinales archaeon]